MSLPLNLFHLILHYFHKNKLACIILFHCWSKETVYRFSLLASTHHSLYVQYVNLNDAVALHNYNDRYLRYNRPQLGIFMDMNCNQTDNFIDEVTLQQNILIKIITSTSVIVVLIFAILMQLVKNSHLRLFNYRFNWFVYDDKANFSRFFDKFKQVNLSVDTEMTFMVPMVPTLLQIQSDVGNGTTVYKAFDVYNNGWFIGGSLNITMNYEMQCNVTGCHLSKYLSDLYKRTLYGNRESLRDVTMRVAVIATRYDLNAPEEDIHNFLMTPKDFHIDPLSRLGIQVFTLLKESLYTNINCTYHDRWTDVDYTGGIVGALVTDSADLASAPCFMSPGRFRFLTSIAITGDFRSVCMFRTPRNSGIQGRVFVEPFSTKVWIIFGIILALAAFFLWLTFTVEYHQMGERFINFVPSLLTTCLISFGSACAQSSFLIPSSMGGRLAFISLSLISFIMYNYYTSVVVSSLLGSPVKSKIKTLGGLADSNLEVGIEPMPYTFTYLNFSTLPDVRRFVNRKIEKKKNFWYSAQDGITKMRDKPGFVFIFETSTGYFLIENQYSAHEICDLNEILFRSDSQLATHLHRNSSYKEIVRLKLMRILETGVHSKHRRQWVRTHLNCLSNNFLINVGMEYAAPLFMMLVCGYFMVLAIFAVEILWHRCKDNRALKLAEDLEHEN